MAEREVGNGLKPFRSTEAVGRGPRTRRFPDCSGNSPYNVEQSLQYPLPPQTCKACKERFETVPYEKLLLFVIPAQAGIQEVIEITGFPPSRE
jgi:hypothetical protein